MGKNAEARLLEPVARATRRFPLGGKLDFLLSLVNVQPWVRHERVKAAKQDLADNRDNSGILDGAKQSLESNVEGIEVQTGKRGKISSKDEIYDPEQMAEQDFSDLMA